MEMLREGLPRPLSQGDSWARVTVDAVEGMEGDGGARYACSCTPACVCAYDTIRFDILIPAYI